MGIIARYILSELIKIFLVALAALTSFVIIFVIVREALRQGLGPVEVLSMVPYALPQALQLTLPGTLLFTACMVYGRMSSSNEITALKAMGISPRVVLRPVFILGLVLSLVAVWLNDVAVSWGAAGIERVVFEAVEEVAYGMLRTQKSYKTDQFEVTVLRVEGRKLIMPWISYQEGKNPAWQISADEAELSTDRAKNNLKIILRNARVEYGGEGKLNYFDKETVELPIPLAAASKSRQTSDLRPSELPMTVIGSRINDQKALIENRKEAMAAEAAYQMITGDFDALASRQWETQRNGLASAVLNLHRLETEPYRRWANGFSCLCFVLVGAPMAIRLRNSDVLTTFFLCFLPILIVYYPLLTVSTESAKRGDLLPIFVWVDNVMLVCWGGWLLRRVFRY